MAMTRRTTKGFQISDNRANSNGVQKSHMTSRFAVRVMEYGDFENLLNRFDGSYTT